MQQIRTHPLNFESIARHTNFYAIPPMPSRFMRTQPLPQMRERMFQLERLFDEAQGIIDRLEDLPILTEIIDETSYPPVRVPIPAAKVTVPAKVSSTVFALGHGSTECSICLTEFVEGEKLSKLVCGHVFHPKCIMPWVEEHCSCPFCRQSAA
jgi:hypothetical protein